MELKRISGKNNKSIIDVSLGISQHNNRVDSGVVLLYNGQFKILHVQMTHANFDPFRTLKYHNSLTVPCNVVEICMLVDK